MVDGSEQGWESLFWTLFERSSNSILLLSEQRRIIEANQPWLTGLGYTRGSAIGRGIDEFIAPREKGESWAAWRSFLATGEYSGRRTFVRSDGSETVCEFAARTATVGGRRLAVYVSDPAVEEARFERPGPCDADALTDREREIVRLIAGGHDTAGIAEELTISPETVKTHVRNAMRKLGVHTRAQLVAVCLSLDADVKIPLLG
ncbi:MAG: LuxR C-terminal-related transcriptional regulator [Solirubrobacteraceae bacterium]